MSRPLRSTLLLTALGLGSAAQAQPAVASQPIPAPKAVRAAAPPANLAANQNAAALAWRNATTPPTQGWTGPVFQLSHDYPQQDPGTCPASVCTWLANKKVQFDATPGEKQAKWKPEWAQYMQQLLAYIRDGQDVQLENAAGWQVNVGGKARWFHVPWMAYDPKAGREFVHGLTNERTAHVSDFLGTSLIVQEGVGPLQLSAKSGPSHNGFETWAFGVYNEWGGYAIGRTWVPEGTPKTAPQPAGPQPAGLPFPQGTLVAKLLFTTATPKDVPYLKGSPVWQAYRHVEQNSGFLCAREVQEVRLIQLDVAVVDEASPTRWVYGTFAYNGNLKGKTVWDRLEPVGVQWGNDPWSSPAAPKADSLPIVQSVLNTQIGTYQHFGCNQRLAGPVDNKLSSCMACHANGYTPQAGLAQGNNIIPPIFGFPGQCTTSSPDNASYFSNNQFPMSYASGQYPNLMNMDGSLQLWVAFLQYGQFHQYSQPQACQDPSGT